MSAIGEYMLLERNKFLKCINLAKLIKETESGFWIFKKTTLSGLDEFLEEWNISIIESNEFKFSGFALATYYIAQEAINNILINEYENEEYRQILEKVFPAVMPFTQKYNLPDLDKEKLQIFCNEEYPDEEDCFDSLLAAHNFFKEGFSKMTGENIFIVNGM